MSIRSARTAISRLRDTCQLPIDPHPGSDTEALVESTDVLAAYQFRQRDVRCGRRRSRSARSIALVELVGVHQIEELPDEGRFILGSLPTVCSSTLVISFLYSVVPFPGCGAVLGKVSQGACRSRKRHEIESTPGAARALDQIVRLSIVVDNSHAPYSDVDTRSSG